MKYIFRTALGVVFAFFFLAFLLVSALRFELLSTKFWTRGVERSGMYQDLTLQIDKLQADFDKKMGKGRMQLKESITEARIRETVETNVKRLIDFLNGKTKALVLSLPLNEWNIPREIMGIFPMVPWSREMDPAKVLASFGVPVEQTKTLIEGLSQAQQVVSGLVWVWLGLLIAALVLMLAHYSLGEGKADKAKGPGMLLIGSGLIAAFIGWGGSAIGSFIAANAKNWPVWAKPLVTGLTAEFFSLGKIAGLVVALAGLALFIWASRVLKEVKGEEIKQKMSFMGKLFKTIAGIVLGVVLLVIGFAVLAFALGGKVNLSAGGIGVSVGGQAK